MGYIKKGTEKWIYNDGFDNGTIITDDGSLKMVGSATTWDDLRTNPTSGDLSGARVPSLDTIAVDGSATSGSGLLFDATTGVDIPYYSAMNSDTMSINCWIKPTKDTNTEILDRDENNYFEFYYNEKDLKILWGGELVTANDVIVAGQIMMVTATAKVIGTSTEINLYVNGSNVQTQTVNVVVGTSSTSTMRLGVWRGDGTWLYEGLLDALYLYNVALTQVQITELYNGGAGTLSHPTGINESNDVIAKFDFNEDGGNNCDNNCTLGAGHDIVLPTSGVTWGDGLMGITTGSLGVKALAFKPNVVNEVFGSAQLPHTYKEGTTIYPHVHFKTATADDHHVVWKLEYLWVNVNDVYGNTNIAMTTISNGSTTNKHIVGDIPTVGLDGTGKKISSVIMFRLYRDGEHVNDTYQGKVYLNEFDFHFEVDAFGSMVRWVK